MVDLDVSKRTLGFRVGFEHDIRLPFDSWGLDVCARECYHSPTKCWGAAFNDAQTRSESGIHQAASNRSLHRIKDIASVLILSQSAGYCLPGRHPQRATNVYFNLLCFHIHGLSQHACLNLPCTTPFGPTCLLWVVLDIVWNFIVWPKLHVSLVCLRNCQAHTALYHDIECIRVLATLLLVLLLVFKSGFWDDDS